MNLDAEKYNWAKKKKKNLEKRDPSKAQVTARKALQLQNKYFGTDESGLQEIKYPSILVAAQHGKVERVKELISKGENVNQISSSNTSYFTALHWAASGGHYEVCKILLEAGAYPNGRDWRNDTPMHWAARNGYAAIVDLLSQYGGWTQHKNSMGQTPLNTACSKSHKSTVDKLIEVGATHVELNPVKPKWAIKKTMLNQVCIFTVLDDLASCVVRHIFKYIYKTKTHLAFVSKLDETCTCGRLSQHICRRRYKSRERVRIRGVHSRVGLAWLLRPYLWGYLAYGDRGASVRIAQASFGKFLPRKRRL